jgi:hypothetical protein
VVGQASLVFGGFRPGRRYELGRLLCAGNQFASRVPSERSRLQPDQRPELSTNPALNGLSSYTNSFAAIECYDSLKARAILNEIDGFSHNRSVKTHVPAVFGMNFQAVSVGQKLIEPGVGSGGYLDAIGTPSPLLQQEIQFVDNAIVATLESDSP